MADIDGIDPQDTVSATVEGSVAASTAHQAELADRVGVAMELPEVPDGAAPDGSFL